MLYNPYNPDPKNGRKRIYERAYRFYIICQRWLQIFLNAVTVAIKPLHHLNPQ